VVLYQRWMFNVVVVRPMVIETNIVEDEKLISIVEVSRTWISTDKLGFVV